VPATTGRHLHSCPDCRLAFDSRQALRRHDALDHRPAPDGVWLTAQLIGTSPSSDELPPNVTGSGLAQLTDEAPSTPAGQPTTTGRPIRVPWVAVLALAAGPDRAHGPDVTPRGHDAPGAGLGLHGALAAPDERVPQRAARPAAPSVQLAPIAPVVRTGPHHNMGEVMLWIVLIVLIAWPQECSAPCWRSPCGPSG
jgi:hypothetical protein